jgi:hypothetical protein
MFHAMQRLSAELKALNLLVVNRERLARVRDIADRTLDPVADYAEKPLPRFPEYGNSEVEEIRTDLQWLAGQIAASDEGWFPSTASWASGWRGIRAASASTRGGRAERRRLRGPLT